MQVCWFRKEEKEAINGRLHTCWSGHKPYKGDNKWQSDADLLGQKRKETIRSRVIAMQACWETRVKEKEDKKWLAELETRQGMVG